MLVHKTKGLLEIEGSSGKISQMMKNPYDKVKGGIRCIGIVGL
ncbi:MAG: hypothetical protein QF535_03165 [Anaerolineales bacterium]|nr:hypothetical protein [Anaerolineales bacterium]